MWNALCVFHHSVSINSLFIELQKFSCFQCAHGCQEVQKCHWSEQTLMNGKKDPAPPTALLRRPLRPPGGGVHSHSKHSDSTPCDVFTACRCVIQVRSIDQVCSTHLVTGCCYKNSSSLMYRISWAELGTWSRERDTQRPQATSDRSTAGERRHCSVWTGESFKAPPHY